MKEYPLTKNNLESLRRILWNMLGAGYWEKGNERKRILAIVKNLDKYYEKLKK